MLIGITGRAGAGKDTAALSILNKGYTHGSFAAPLKAALNAMMGWQPWMWEDRVWKEQVQHPLNMSPRDMALSLGTQWGREIVDPNIWVTLAISQSSPQTVFTDIRFLNEAEAVINRGGIIIEVVRPNNPFPVIDHVSEEPLPRNIVDHVVTNEGSIQELKRQMDEIIDAY